MEAWRVHDTGLIAAPGPFRRLPGRVRHHRGDEDLLPDRVVIELAGDELVVSAADGAQIGRWPRVDVAARTLASGPPLTFVLDLPGGSHLLAAPADDDSVALLAALHTG